MKKKLLCSMLVGVLLISALVLPALAADWELPRQVGEIFVDADGTVQKVVSVDRTACVPEEYVEAGILNADGSPGENIDDISEEELGAIPVYMEVVVSEDVED